jgi:hypothetical protein
VPYDVYSPMVIAMIKALNPTTADRCLPIVMQRGADDRMNLEVDPGDPDLVRLRSATYRALLRDCSRVQASAAAVTCPAWLRGRPRELWKPLLALADAAGDATGRDALLALALDHVRERDEASPEVYALIAALGRRLAGLQDQAVYPADLAEELRQRLGWRDAPTPHAVGHWLRSLGLRGRHTREGAEYRVTAEELAAVTSRHTPQSIVTSSPSPDNPAK